MARGRNTDSVVDVEPSAIARREPVWWLAGLGAILIILTTLAFSSRLPHPMAAQWAWHGPPTRSLSPWAWAAIWSLAWALVTTPLTRMSSHLDWRRWVHVGVAGVLVAGHVTALENNMGAEVWTEAEPLDLGIVVALSAVGALLVWFAARFWEN